VHHKPLTITFSSDETGNAALYSGAGGAASALAACRNSRETTAMHKKKSGIRIEKEARRRARAGIGMPPAARLIPDKRNKPPKHKKTPLDSGRA